MAESCFDRVVIPCLKRLAEVLRAWRPQVIRPRDRKEGFLGSWNHVEWFPFNVTYTPDGYPNIVWKSATWELDVQKHAKARALLGWTDDDLRRGQIGTRYLKSGKYNTAVIKSMLIIALNGLILHHSLELGVDNDDTIMDSLIDSGEWETEDGEFGLGDKAFIAIKGVLCGYKPEETQFESFWNSIISYYRARSEIVNAKMKKHA